MPILYINKINHNMKELREMTQMEAMDWSRIQNIPVLNGYNKEISESNLENLDFLVSQMFTSDFYLDIYFK